MNLKMQATALWNAKRRELEAVYPSLKAGPVAPKPKRRLRPMTLPEPYRLVLGRDEHGPFSFDSRLLCAHIDIVGGIGTGKSNAMRQLAWLNIDSAPSLKRATIIIDPNGNHADSFHRATIRRIIETESYKKRPVYVIDANCAWCTGIKLLGSSAVPSVDADNGIEAFQRLRGDEEFGPTLRRALHGLLAGLAELGWTLAEADLLLDPFDVHGIRAWAIERVKDRYAKRALLRLDTLASDPRLRADFQIETIGTENRLAPLLSSPAMRAIVGTPTIDMGRDVLDAGAVLLVDTSGRDQASEIAGDLLGKLVIRALLHAAKRRKSDSLALLFADECARYVSQDWERALAELRKYRVGFVSGHQTYAMLGKPDDPVRLAIERIPATKIAFRMNSMEEASTLAPEIMHLNLEQPVEVLTKPTVIGQKKVRLKSASIGTSAAVTDTVSDAMNESTTVEEGTQRSKTHSRSETLSESETDEENWSHTHTDSESIGESDTVGESESCSSGQSGSRGENSGSSTSSGSSLAYDRDGLVTGQPSGGSTSNGTGSSAGSNRSSGWSEEEVHGSSTAHTESHTFTSSDSDTVGGSHSQTVGRATTEGNADTVGTSHSRASTTGSTRGTSRGSTQGHSSNVGWSEGFEPLMANLPVAVHSLENVKHYAGELLCSLPTGTCVVRTVEGGRIEGAIVRVPERPCAPVDDKQYATDVALIVDYGSAGVAMEVAQAAIAAREERIVATAAALVTGAIEEPQSFRVPVRHIAKAKRKPR